jgi:hypothetical protein
MRAEPVRGLTSCTNPIESNRRICRFGRNRPPRSHRSSFTACSEDVIHFVYADLRPDELVLHVIDATGNELDSVVVPR